MADSQALFDPQAHRLEIRGDPATGGLRVIELPLTISAVQDGVTWAVWVRNLGLGISLDFNVAALNEEEALRAAEDALRGARITVTKVGSDAT